MANVKHFEPKIRPKAAKPARAHRLPKIHKKFDKIPKFRPIIDATGTTHYGVGKFLSQLLQPLTINEHTVKDTFDAKSRIRTINQALFSQGYQYVSFDVESLFTNVPLEGTLAVIEKRIYDEKELYTSLKKITLRKLIRDTCKKTIFSCSGVYYEQVDGVKRVALSPVLDFLLHKFHSFDHNIRFTYDAFSDEPPHFLDLNLVGNRFSIYRKHTFTGQYTCLALLSSFPSL